MNKIREKTLTVLNHVLIDLDTMDKLADRHGYHRFNLLRGEVSELKNELDRMEAENPGKDALTLAVSIVNGVFYGRIAVKDYANMIQQFAERYHQSRMGEKIGHLRVGKGGFSIDIDGVGDFKKDLHGNYDLYIGVK